MQLDLLRGKVDLVVLARYMQILAPSSCAFAGRSSTSITRSCPRSPAPSRTTRRRRAA